MGPGKIEKSGWKARPGFDIRLNLHLESARRQCKYARDMIPLLGAANRFISPVAKFRELVAASSGDRLLYIGVDSQSLSQRVEATKLSAINTGSLPPSSLHPTCTSIGSIESCWLDFGQGQIPRHGGMLQSNNRNLSDFNLVSPIMSGIFSTLWTIGRAYKPNATRDREAKPLRFGAFAATYKPPGWAVRRPRTDAEAQRLYNHVRTVAYWLDAAPVLADLGLPFKAGLDDVISLVPIYGDIVAGILQLYQVWLSFIFGVPRNIIGLMILNVLIDVFVGVIPILGDFLDNLFKSNLRNLALLEDWLLTGKTATAKYHILLMPDGGDFLPPPKKQAKGKWSKVWFGSTSHAEEDEERQRERVGGKVEKTRRMRRDEGEDWGATPVPAPSGPVPGAGLGDEPTSAGPSGATRSQRAGQVPVQPGLY